MTSRSHFLSALLSTPTAYVRPEDNQCPICLEKMLVAGDRKAITRSRSRSPERSRGRTSQDNDERGNTTSRRRILSPFASQPYDRSRRAVPMHGDHIACEGCIRTWLARENDRDTCPLCRKKLFSSGVSDEITLSSPLANTDAEALARISGTEASWSAMYAGALADQDAADVNFASSNIVEVMQSRLTRFRESRSVWGLRHGSYTSNVRADTSRRLIWITHGAREAATVLWTWWWWPLFASTNANGSRTMVHHPVAFELLVAVMQAFKRWESTWGTYRTTVSHHAAMVRAALRPCLERRGVRIGTFGLDAYVEDLVQAAAQAAVHGTIQTSVEKWTKEPLPDVVKSHGWINDI